MEKILPRPKSEDELKEREAAGFWQAQALAKRIGEGSEKITIDVILGIHKVFFLYANRDIAGRFRRVGEDIKKLKCVEPPPGSAVLKRMFEFWREFDTRLSNVPPRPRVKGKKALRKALAIWNDRVLDVAAWTQYQMASIHPFSEGNGRMARLMTNLILFRHGLQPSDLKYEGENKKVYLDAMCKIDHENDFRPLKQLIQKGMIESYHKLIEAKRKAARKPSRHKS
jgi:cell filamentation protein